MFILVLPRIYEKRSARRLREQASGVLVVETMDEVDLFVQGDQEVLARVANRSTQVSMRP
jgi:hypothetical protein